MKTVTPAELSAAPNIFSNLTTLLGVLMTAVSNRPSTSASVAEGTLPGALSDQLAEAIASHPDPHTRAVAIAGLIVEVFETVRWLHGSSPDEEELTSLYRLVAQSYAHRSRMAARAATGGRR